MNYMHTISKIQNDVANLMNQASGHGFDHIERVYHLAIKLADQENADRETVALAALLHDVDDYKFVGKEKASLLSNARQIMKKYQISEETQTKVCEIILTMGYSNCLKGIRPKTKEGAIVSDADMLDAMGALGIVRTFEYQLSKPNGVIFDPTVFPVENMSSDAYQTKSDGREPAVNHFFDKLLKLKDLMMTDAAKKEAQHRHLFMVLFLKELFMEHNQKAWLDYLDAYLKK